MKTEVYIWIVNVCHLWYRKKRDKCIQKQSSQIFFLLEYKWSALLDTLPLVLMHSNLHIAYMRVGMLNYQVSETVNVLIEKVLIYTADIFESTSIRDDLPNSCEQATICH